LENPCAQRREEPHPDVGRAQRDLERERGHRLLPRRYDRTERSGRVCASSFSRVARRSLMLRPAHSRGHRIVARLPEGFSLFVTSMAAPELPAGTVRRVGFALTGKRRLCTADANSGRSRPPKFMLGITGHKAEPRSLVIACAAMDSPWQAFEDQRCRPT
jgi:hypothetical protein